METTLQYAEVVTETDLAILFIIAGNQVWVPKSVIISQEGNDSGGSIDVQSWFVEKNNIL